MKADELQRLVDAIETLKEQGRATPAEAATLALGAGILGELGRIADAAEKLANANDR